MDTLFTIGVYGFDADSFYAALQGSGVDLLLDVRRRRGVRGAAYAFANAKRLQAGLEGRGIAYRHAIDLAPREETRQLQRQEDAADRVAKRQRTTLSNAFVDDYRRRTLEPFDWGDLVAELDAYRRPALLCVERNAVACHRRLVADRLAAITAVPVRDLAP
jgi:uncharacterized protein (DUF488 family)